MQTDELRCDQATDGLLWLALVDEIAMLEPSLASPHHNIDCIAIGIKDFYIQLLQSIMVHGVFTSGVVIAGDFSFLFSST